MSTNIIEFLNKEIGLSSGSHESSELLNSRDLLVSKIAEYIEWLLVKDQNKLFQILYRIDISESQIEAAFSLGKTKLTCKKMAELILDRSLKKLQTQADFKAGSDFEN